MSDARPTLDLDRIVEAAHALIRADGLARFSMRKLGKRLGVDPMAVYHHVANKQALLALVMARVVARLPSTDPAAPWHDRVRHWAGAYWDGVVADRELVAAGLADPVIAAGGIPATDALRAAIADSGLPSDLVEPNVHLVVDLVHGSGLGTATMSSAGDADALRSAFERGLDTVLAGIAAVAATADGGAWIGSSGAVRQLRVVVEAADFDAAVAFYRDELGLPELAAYAGAGDARVVILAAGRATLELANPAQVDMIDDVEVGRRVSPHVRVAFEVADVDAVTERLVAAGATPIADPVVTPWRSRNSRLGGAGGLQLTVFEELESADARATRPGFGTDRGPTG